MAGLKTPRMGEGYAPAYQISATPFVTGSSLALGETHELKFGHVTRFFTVRSVGATSTAIAVGFTENGLLPVNGNYLTLSGSESYTGELRVDRLFISGAVGAGEYNVIAGLTPIKTREFQRVTGSNGYLGVG